MKTMFKASLLFVCILLLVGCSADELTDGKDKLPPDLEGMTLFEAKAAPSTRTAVVRWQSYLDKNETLILGWEMGDGIWIQKAPGSAEWIKSTTSRSFYWTEYRSKWPNIEAIFCYPGRLTEDSYRVRYTGYGNSMTYDKVTIPSKQKLRLAYQGDNHDFTNPFAIGENGDCGVAIARKPRQDSKWYEFQLEHKAAYIGIAPYSSDNTMASEENSKIYLESIKVTADKAICGTFNFNDDGIDLSSRPAATDANKTITVEGCGIPRTDDNSVHIYEKNFLSVMVIAPGTYGTFKVEYVLGKAGEPENKVTITKEYKNVTFTAGKVKWMKPDFRAEKYSQREDHAKWRDSKVKECPNINEIRWYIEKGDPHWSKFFYCDTYREHIYFYDGIWVKKLSVIAKENGKTVEDLKAMAPDGTNYINTRNNGDKQINGIPTGIPADTKDYFFIPALGRHDVSKYDGKEGFFWSSSESYYDEAYVLHFKEGMVEVMGEKKSNHFYLWKGL